MGAFLDLDLVFFFLEKGVRSISKEIRTDWGLQRSEID